MSGALATRLGRRAAALLVPWLLLVALALPAAAAAPPQALRLEQAPLDRLLLWRHLVVLQNLAGANLSPEEAAAAIDAGGPDVIRPERPEHSLGRRATPIWARFTLEHAGAAPIELVLAQRYPTIEHVSLYRLRGTQWQPILGTHETAREMFARDRFANFRLALQPGERATYLVKMQTVAPLRWVLSLQEPNAFVTEQRRHDWALAFGYTVPLAVLLLIAMLYRLNTAPGLGYFIGLSAADIVATTWITGFGAELLPTLSGEALRAIGHVAYAAMLFCGPRHALAFAGAASPRGLRRAARTLSIAGPVGLLLVQAVDPAISGPMPGALGLLMALLCCAMAWHARRHGLPHAGAYIVAWMAYVVTTLMYFFVRLEMWPLEVLPLMIFGQSLALTILMGHTVARAVVDSDGRLRVALQEAESQQRQIEALSAERERLFAAASHDLRQPLQAIAINVELLQHRLDAAVPAGAVDDRALLDRMQAALTGTNELLESLLDLRLDAFSQAAVEQVPLGLAPLLERLGAEYRSSTAARGLMLRVAPTRAWVRSDPQRLERVLRNLLANAVRYTETGWVLIGVRRGPGAHWRVQVMDTGAGIDPRRAGQLFGEHVRGVDERHGGAPGGYGLGLYIVQRLADAMGVRVGVHPRTGDWREGSVFEVVLPMCEPQCAVELRATAREAAHSRPLLGRQVLLVDDDRQSREALAQGLAELGAAVTARAVPPDAPVDAAAWDAVVCDHNLGARRTGLDVLVAQGQGLRVLVSGHLAAAHEARAVAHGIVPLHKPVSLATLARVLTGDHAAAEAHLAVVEHG